MHQDQQESAFATDATLEVSIRTATSNDIEDVLALVRVCIDYLRSRGIEQWDEVYPDHNTIERDVRTSTTFLASNARETVGAIVLNDHQDPEYAEVPWQFMTGCVAVIHRLMIRPTMEGKGLGAHAHALRGGTHLDERLSQHRLHGEPQSAPTV